MPLLPHSPEELAEALVKATEQKQRIRIFGGDSKRVMGGPIGESDTEISTREMRRVLAYEPTDLTISVEAGMPFRQLEQLLADKGQMLPLDPPFAQSGTIAGTLAANLSGPRRRLYGTARDLIIGMKYVTVEGRVVQSGGMVVKNVAGLDTAKLMVGSWGTLAAIAVVNFKVLPKPPCSRTFLMTFDTAGSLARKRNAILNSVLQPCAIDVLNPAAAKRLGLSGFVLAVQVAGSAKVIARYNTEFTGSVALEDAQETSFWNQIRDFAPQFMVENPTGIVMKIPRTIQSMVETLSIQEPVLGRGGNGVCYACYATGAPAVFPSGAVLDYSPEFNRSGQTLWPSPGPDFKIMQNLKGLFDPANLLNQGRLYGRI